MLFPTFSFAFFFLVVFIGFWYVFRGNLERRIFLVAAGYFFYALWDWRFCGILFLSTAANYGFGLLLGTNRDHVWRKTFLVLFAESANYFIQQYAAQASASGSSPAVQTFLFPVLAVIMPVGISFYTFKSMSYVFDVYLCRLPAVRSFLDVMLYVSFFPQVASGPIVGASDFFPQITEAANAGREVGSRPIEFDRAAILILSGLIKKMVFANFLSTLFVDPVFANPALFSTVEVFLAAVGYSVVIYCDFSGYSDMAIGIALLLGFRTPANFDRPYISFSVTEFWKRWHITFSFWLRDYLYFSMGGSRFGKVRTLIALVLTMMLGGLWHGAALNFVIWGAMQGTALALERAFNYGNRRSNRPGIATVQIFCTFLFTTFSWIVFRSKSLDAIRDYLLSFGNLSTDVTLLTPLVVFLLILGLLMHGIPSRVRSFCFQAYQHTPLPAKGFLLAVFFVFLSVVSMSGVAPFIYFQF
jgi:alginate O-acetyltransferase complex protein AlgI